MHNNKNSGETKNREVDFSKNDIHQGEIKTHLERIGHEFENGFVFLKKYPRSVTVFGSSMAKPEDEHYRKAEELGSKIASETGYTVITGGGPGVMEAANKGAYQTGGSSVGLNISLPHEHSANPYIKDSMKFSYFFSRKAILMFAAEAYVFFPGGYGTFDELFSVLTLIQTDKIPHVPVVLFGSKFWGPFRELLQKTMAHSYHTIEDKDLNLFEITDSVDRVVEIVKKAPVSEWWRNIN